MFRPPTKYSEYLQDVRKSIDYILSRVNSTTVGTLQQVTNAGSTTTNAITTGGITTDYVQLNTLATPTLAPGMFAWNDAFGTADLRLKGGNVTLQLGQETLARVVNKTGADLLESQYRVVRVRIASEGGSQGQRLAVVLAQGNNDPDSVTTLGIVTETILNNQEGFITVFGNVNNIDTTGSLQGETWLDGDVLYLSPTIPGALTKVKPIAPNHSVTMGYVIYAHGVNGKIFVKVDNGYELDELHNVRITAVANNDLLQYDSVQQVWKNVAASVAVPTPTLAQVTTAGNTTTNAITVGGLEVKSGAIYVANTGNHTAQGYTFRIWSTSNNFTLDLNGTGSITHQQVLIFGIGNATSYNEAMRVASTRNVLIGTTTDAGYKLDVNGTVRVVNKTNIGSETVSQGSLYIGHNGTAGGSNGTSTVFFVSQFGNYPYRLGAEGNGYDFYLRQANGGQGSINIDFSGLNSISYNITNTNVLNQSFGKSVVIDAKTSLNSYLAIGTRFGFSDSLTAGDSPLIFFRSMSGSYYDKTLDAAVTIRNGLPTVADNNITKNTAYWYRNGYIGIGTSTTLSATNTLKGAITINQGTTIGYQNLNPGSLSSVITSGTSTTVTFTPNNGNVVPGYDIIVGTIITANGVSRRVTAVNYQSVTVDSAVDWSAGYNYTYRNPYVSIADGSTPIFDILPSGNVAVGTTTGLAKFTVAGSITAASAIARGVYFNNTLVAAANNDVLVGLDINPTFTNGAFTGVSNLAIRAYGYSNFQTGINIFPGNPAISGGIPIQGALFTFSGAAVNYYAGYQSGSGFSHRFYTNNQTERVRISDGSTSIVSGNLLVGTTTDAGYKLDVNGTTRLNGNTLVSGNLTVSGSQNFFSTLNSYIFFSRGAGTGINFTPANEINAASQSGVVIMDSAYGKVAYGGGTHTFNALAINTNISTGGSYNGIIRGIYYNPTLTSTTGVTHRAIETTSGDVIFNTQSASANAGYTTMAIGGSSGAYFQMYVGTNPAAQTLRGQIWAVGNNLIFNNPSVGYLGLYTTLYSGITVWPTTGNVYVGTSASTDAGYKLDVNGTSRFTQAVVVNAGGVKTESGTITAQTGVNSGRMTMFNLRNTGGGYQSAVGASLAIAFTNRETGAVWSDDVIENVVYSNTAGSVTTGYSFYTHSNQTYNASPVLAMSINGTNVGIGTPTPTEKLHIVDNTNGNKFARISAGAADASAAWVAQNDQVDNIVYRVFGSGVAGFQMGIALARSASLIANLDGTGKFLIGTYSNTDIIFGTGDQSRIRVSGSNGNVMIGTLTDIGTKLNVSGEINSAGYRVNNVFGWSGTINIPTTPPISITVDGGIITNVV